MNKVLIKFQITNLKWTNPKRSIILKKQNNLFLYNILYLCSYDYTKRTKNIYLKRIKYSAPSQPFVYYSSSHGYNNI